MSRSDNTAKDGKVAYPKRGAGFRVNWVRRRNKAERKNARMALHAGREPVTTALTHRHSALWDRF